MFLKKYFFCFFLFLFLPAFVVLSSKSHGQGAATQMITELHQSVRVEVEADMQIIFTEEEEIKRQISTADMFNTSDAGASAAVIRITGGAAEFMIDIEKDLIDTTIAGDEMDFKLYDFDIVQEGAGNWVTVMPFATDTTFVLSIGSTVEGASDGQYHEALNFFNVNYL